MAAQQSATLILDWDYHPSPRRLAHRMGRLAKQHPLGVFGLVVLVGFVFLGLFGPYIAPYDPKELSTGPQLAGPSLAHPFGTNALGQDVFSRVIAGARLSLTIAGASIFIGSTVGSALGIIAGFYGRWVDYLVQRSSEAFNAFPFLVAYFLLRTAMGTGVEVIVVAIAITALFGGNRILRGATIVERHATYVEAARSIGCRESRILLRHVVPNVLPLTVILMSGALGGAILAESALAFLGLGVAGVPSWGLDMSGDNLAFARVGYWHLAIFPGLAISLVVLGANLLGDSLRDIWDPRLRK